LRGGWQSLFLADAEGGLCAGAGILATLFGEDLKGRVDYAYTDFGRLKEIHTIAISVHF
jgi:hypothetical protein